MKKTFFLNDLTSTSSFYMPNKKSKWIKFKNFLLNNKNIPLGRVLLDVTKLDDLLENKELKKTPPKKMFLLKIDVEGFEYDVLKGASKLLRSKLIDYILIEQANYNIYLREGNKDSIDIERILNKYNYDLKKSFLFPTLSFKDNLYELRAENN